PTPPPVSAPASTAPAAVETPAPTAIVPAPVAPSKPAAVAARTALPPLPPCNEDDPTTSLRPPPPGSTVHSRKAPQLGTLADRRRREQTSDYSLFELLSLTDYEYAGACMSDGRPTHVVTFRPPETFDPQNPVERVVGAMSGTILVDGLDFEVARAEGTTIAPIKWGAGMVALKAAHVLFDYTRVQGEV